MVIERWTCGQNTKFLSVSSMVGVDRIKKIKSNFSNSLGCPLGVHINCIIDMPAHVRSALTQTSLSIPVLQGKPALGQWQGIFLYEHRHIPANRRVILHLMGD